MSSPAIATAAGADAPAPGTLTVLLSPQPGLKSRPQSARPDRRRGCRPARTHPHACAPRSVHDLRPRGFARRLRGDCWRRPRRRAGARPLTHSILRRSGPWSRCRRRRRWCGGRRADGAGAARRIRTAPVRVNAATPLVVTLSLTYVRDPTRDDAAVRAGCNAALLDPDSGLFGVNAVGIGQVIYDSQIYAACLCGAGRRRGARARVSDWPAVRAVPADLLRLASFRLRTTSGAAELHGASARPRRGRASSRCRTTATTYCCRGRHERHRRQL